jgi:hypothetical protein
MLRRLLQAVIVVAAAALFSFAWRCDFAWFERHIFLPQQFFIVANPRIVPLTRAVAALFAALLLLAIPRIPRGEAARRLFVALLLAIPAAEVLLQWRTRHLVRPELKTQMATLTSPNARYGITLNPSMNLTWRTAGREIHVVTDAESRRIPGAAIDPSLPSLVFTGESTIVGPSVQWDETFPAILGARLQLQVVNLASLNYRLDQSLQRLEDALPKLAPPAAVIGLFMPGLVGRSFAGELHPVARPTSAGGVEITPPEEPRFWQRSGFYLLWRHLYWSDAELQEGMASMAAVLREMSSQAKARGARCIFIVTGHTPRWMTRELFDANGLDYVSVEIPPQELLSDGHPNIQGNLRIADALEPRLPRKGQ